MDIPFHISTTHAYISLHVLPVDSASIIAESVHAILS